MLLGVTNGLGKALLVFSRQSPGLAAKRPAAHHADPTFKHYLTHWSIALRLEKLCPRILVN